jgi:hypothetical protein
VPAESGVGEAVVCGVEGAGWRQVGDAGVGEGVGGDEWWCGGSGGQEGECVILIGD